MIELAIGGHTGLAVCREEIERGGLSYTVDTLARLHALHPECELFFLLGADALADIGSWKEPARIGELADLVVVRRAGRPAPDFGPLLPWATPERVARWQAHQVQMPQIDLSASDLRGRVARGLSIRYRTPRAVEQFILSQGLYRPDAEPDAV
jgi:nicotinate-nucleotide adenylyltransferase